MVNAIASAAYDQKAIACRLIYYGWLRSAIAFSNPLGAKVRSLRDVSRSLIGRFIRVAFEV
jgi:hypothetical protein